VTLIRYSGPIRISGRFLDSANPSTADVDARRSAAACLRIGAPLRRRRSLASCICFGGTACRSFSPAEGSAEMRKNKGRGHITVLGRETVEAESLALGVWELASAGIVLKYKPVCDY
jgi:hypothetical protein